MNNNILIGTNVKIFGDVQIGKNTIIEDNVCLGHPSHVELENNKSQNFSTLDELYSNSVKNKTIIGSNSIIRSGSIIYSGCNIGDNFDCGHYVIIRENSIIGLNVYIKPNTYVMTFVKIGDYCRIAGTIADYSILGSNVSSFGTLTHRRLRRYSEYSMEQKKNPNDAYGPIIGDNCIIGRDAVIIGNIKIGNNAIIGANTFVDFEVKENAKIIGIKGSEYNNNQIKL